MTPNVVVLVLDALVARHLGALGHWPSPTPTLDALAGQGALWSNLWANGCPTQISLPSIMASELPLDSGGYEFGVADRTALLAEVFKSAGYRTGLFSAGPAMAPFFGYDRGFDRVANFVSWPRFVEDVLFRHRKAAVAWRDAGQMDRCAIAQYVAPFMRRLLTSGESFIQDREREIQDGAPHVLAAHGWDWSRLRAAIAHELRLYESDPVAYVAEILFAPDEPLSPRLYAASAGALEFADAERKQLLGPIGANTLPIHPKLGFVSGARLLDAFGHWRQSAGTGPFFAFVHMMDVHDYNCLSIGCPDTPASELMGEVRAACERLDLLARAGRGAAAGHPHYDLGIHYVDRLVARLLLELDAEGFAENTVLAVVADHGWMNGFPPLRPDEQDSIWVSKDALFHVPLLLAGAGIPTARYSDLGSLLDFAPTLLAAAGLESPAAFQGRDLLGAPGAAPYVIAEDLGSGPCAIEHKPIRVIVRSEDTKVVAVRQPSALGGRTSVVEVYDLGRDPLEFENLATGAWPAGAHALAAVAQERIADLVLVNHLA